MRVWEENDVALAFVRFSFELLRLFFLVRTGSHTPCIRDSGFLSQKSKKEISLFDLLPLISCFSSSKNLLAPISRWGLRSVSDCG